MESSLKIKEQRGYLLILAIVIIVIVAFVGVTLVRMFIGSSSSESNVALSNQVFYIANSGMEIAKHNIVENKLDCNVINGQSFYTDKPLFNGRFTVTGHDNSATNALLNTIAANSTSLQLKNSFPATLLANSINAAEINNIKLSSISGFASKGLVKIDNELISYRGIVGSAPYTLSGVNRGAAGTIAVSHSNGATIIGGFSPKGVVVIDSEIIPYSGINYGTGTLLNAVRLAGATSHEVDASVTQNECIITSTAAIPMFTAPQARRTIQQILIKNSSNGGFSVGGYYPRSAFTGQVILNNGTINNVGSICPNNIGESGAGSTIITSGNVIFNGTANTLLDKTCSVVGSLKPDVLRNFIFKDADGNPTAIWNLYFNANKNTVLGSANDTYTLTDNDQAHPELLVNYLNNSSRSGKTVVVTEGSQQRQIIINNPSSNITIGSPTNPVVLIINVSNGMNVNANNFTFTVYGLLYVINKSNYPYFTINLGGTSDKFKIYGAMVVEGQVTFNSNSAMDLYPFDFSLLEAINNHLNLDSSYGPSAFGAHELFN